MRLIAWNTNHRRSLEENVQLLEPFNADILVLSETRAPLPENPLNAQRIGSDKQRGLAVVALTGLQLSPHPANSETPTLMSAFFVSGKVAFDLLAIWPVQPKTKKPTYHEILMAAVDRYADLLRSGRAIMAGDFNSSTRVEKQKSTHPQFVERLDSIGLVSVYHEQTGELHGNESVATFRQATKEFHIDYCFVAKQFICSAKISVLYGPEWKDRSDHFPLVLDVEDAALMT